MEIKVLGTGCAKCKSLEKLVHEAVAELGVSAQVEKVEDIRQIMAHGIMSTPGLVVDGKVVLSGRLPGYQEVLTLLRNR